MLPFDIIKAIPEPVAALAAYPLRICNEFAYCFGKIKLRCRHQAGIMWRVPKRLYLFTCTREVKCTSDERYIFSTSNTKLQKHITLGVPRRLMNWRGMLLFVWLIPRENVDTVRTRKLSHGKKRKFAIHASIHIQFLSVEMTQSICVLCKCRNTPDTWAILANYNIINWRRFVFPSRNAVHTESKASMKTEWRLSSSL